MTKNFNIIEAEKNSNFLISKIAIILLKGLNEGRPS